MHVTPVSATQGDGIEKVFGIAFCDYAAGCFGNEGHNDRSALGRR
jgi:hypothetical protein